MVSIPSSRDRATLHWSVALNGFKSPTQFLQRKDHPVGGGLFFVLFRHYRYFLSATRKKCNSKKETIFTCLRFVVISSCYYPEITPMVIRTPTRHLKSAPGSEKAFQCHHWWQTPAALQDSLNRTKLIVYDHLLHHQSSGCFA